MNAPLLPRLLLAATVPAADSESVLGDLNEEYMERRGRSSRGDADSWYWSQTLRSIPALLSYSRNDVAWQSRAVTAVIVVAVLVGMLFAKDLLDRSLDALRPNGSLPAALYFGIDWGIAALFGGFLATIVRYHPVRLAMISSAVLAAAIAAPGVLDAAPLLTLPAWILLLGAIPAMSLGAATVRTFRKH